MKVVWSKPASDDLNTIEEYIANDNPLAAIDQILHIIERVENQLPDHPLSGPCGVVIGTREFLISPYMAVYRVENAAIQILRVLHTTRQWPSDSS